MNDRFSTGLLSGIFAGIAYLAWSLASRFILQWSNKSLAGYGAMISFNRAPESTLEYVWGSAVVLGISAAIGIIFAYLLLLINHEHLYVKAIAFSAATWFFINDVIIPRITITMGSPYTLGAVSSAALGSILYALVLAYSFYRMADRSLL